MSDTPNNDTISGRTRVEMGILVLAGTALLGGAVWTTNTSRDISDLKRSVAQIGVTLEKGTADRWRQTDMRVWAKRLGELNPDLRLPDIDLLTSPSGSP